MSSPRSPRHPDALAALGAAAVRVAEDSLFAFAEPCDADRVAGLLQDRTGTEPWLSAAVAFTGPFEGVVRIALPHALAGELASAFSGLPADSLGDAEVSDFAGELANMVCGLWLTQTHRSEHFSLAAPVVSVARAGVMAAAAAEPDALGLVLNDAPVLVALAAATPVA